MGWDSAEFELLDVVDQNNLALVVVDHGHLVSLEQLLEALVLRDSVREELVDQTECVFVHGLREEVRADLSENLGIDLVLRVADQNLLNLEVVLPVFGALIQHQLNLLLLDEFVVQCLVLHHVLVEGPTLLIIVEIGVVHLAVAVNRVESVV
eukprot:CAMPEP_0116914940 /NCGR_PEP_ID=MMETSP0467-20121206/17627_1 /TAXON_ID=283647 /ORGANISM="Mesodinium pulex, Strain SPMC105" /LENGTH=151 /DNA_ID=CAMNT_0004591499 /DNA_START=973 /DNA_END=1427 /DNA_ORIENTATION=-